MRGLVTNNTMDGDTAGLRLKASLRQEGGKGCDFCLTDKQKPQDFAWGKVLLRLKS